MQFANIALQTWLILLCICLCINTAFGLQDISRNQKHSYPRNITDLYKGVWSVANSSYIPTFEKREGHFLYTIVNFQSSRVEDVDEVEGDMVLRDGVYSTDASLRYYLRGVYLPKSGQLMLAAMTTPAAVTATAAAGGEEQNNINITSFYSPDLPPAQAFVRAFLAYHAATAANNGSTNSSATTSTARSNGNSSSNAGAVTDTTECSLLVLFLQVAAQTQQTQGARVTPLAAHATQATDPAGPGGVVYLPFNPHDPSDDLADADDAEAGGPQQQQYSMSGTLYGGLGLAIIAATDQQQQEQQQQQQQQQEQQQRQQSHATSGEGGVGEQLSALSGCSETQLVADVTARTLLLALYYRKWLNYVVMLAAGSFIQIFVTIRQMEHTSTQAGASKVSLLMVGMQAVMDSYLCLIHLLVGIVFESMFNAFATAAFFEFVTFSIFEMRYLLLVIKARSPHAFQQGWQSVRRELSVFYARFYGALVGGVVIMWWLSHLTAAFVIILHSFWVPQIICSASRDAHRPLLKQYIFGISITRLAIPAYFYLCPHNFIPSEPRPSVGLLLVGWMAVQVIVLLLQDRLGPQFFIPSFLLPPKYEYQRRATHVQPDQRQCVICMNEVETRGPRGEYMLTPCDHIFHTSCLAQWMEFKLECPTCRRPLPP